MAYTRKEICAKTGIKSKHISTYVDRKQLIPNELGLFDMTDETNIAFMEKYESEKTGALAFDSPRAKEKNEKNLGAKAKPAARVVAIGSEFADDGDIFIPKGAFKPTTAKKPKEDWDEDEDQDPDEDDLDENGIPKYIVSERAFKHWQAKKFETEQALKQLELEKKMGELIPTDLVGGLISQQSKSFSGVFRQAAEKLIDLLIVKYKLSPQDAADMRRILVETVNKAVADSISESKKAIKGIVAEYSEKRKNG